MTSNRAYAAPLTYPIYQTSSYIVPEGENTGTAGSITQPLKILALR